MGLFGKLFDKKSCAICGGEIGLFGNRKLEDGNLCKNCAAKLSPWFSERRNSTVEQIAKQLEYREANKAQAAAFHTTRTLGTDMKVLLDEDAKKFVVTRARDLAEANPDVLDFSQVTGVDLDVDEHSSEDKKKDAEGKSVSYNPPRYFYSYSFRVIIHVNHPYFDEISFQVGSSSVDVNPEASVPASRKPNPLTNQDYVRHMIMCKEIQETLTGARSQAREEAAAAAAPKVPVKCPNCGATSVPDEKGCCEFCGSVL